jgi:hypothetical protein
VKGLKPLAPVAVALALAGCTSGSPSVTSTLTGSAAPSAASTTGTPFVPPSHIIHASAASCSALADAQRDSTEALSDVNAGTPDLTSDAKLMAAVAALMTKAIAEPSGDSNFDAAAKSALAAATTLGVTLKAAHPDPTELLRQLKAVDADLSAADGECPD